MGGTGTYVFVWFAGCTFFFFFQLLPFPGRLWRWLISCSANVYAVSWKAPPTWNRWCLHRLTVKLCRNFHILQRVRCQALEQAASSMPVISVQPDWCVTLTIPYFCAWGCVCYGGVHDATAVASPGDLPRSAPRTASIPGEARSWRPPWRHPLDTPSILTSVCSVVTERVKRQGSVYVKLLHSTWLYKASLQYIMFVENWTLLLEWNVIIIRRSRLTY